MKCIASKGKNCCKLQSSHFKITLILMRVKLERKHFNIGEFSGKPLVPFVGFCTAAIHVPQELHTHRIFPLKISGQTYVFSSVCI